MVSGNPFKNALFDTRAKKYPLPLKGKGYFIYKPIISYWISRACITASWSEMSMLISSINSDGTTTNLKYWF